MERAVHLLRLSRLRAALSSGEARRIRESHRLTIGEVARASGVDQSTVWRWEQGTRRPRGANALAYADLLESLREAAPDPPLGNGSGAGVAAPAPPVDHANRDQ